MSSATRAPPGTPWNARWTSWNPTARSCRSSCTPFPALLERHPRHRTAHAALIAGILDLLAGASRSASSPEQPLSPRDPLSESEIRVLRYLPTNLSAREIADELFLSWYTVKTHMRHLYAKLGTHTRHETVDRARALGLLAPSPRKLAD